jgi:phosphohistidine phosphatase
MKALANRLTEENLVPDFVFCSPARRTRMTLENLLPGVQASFPERLYNASAETILDIVRESDDSHQEVMVIAHNPGIFNFTRLMAETGAELPPGYAPGTLTVLECAAESWFDLMPARNRMRTIITP